MPDIKRNRYCFLFFNISYVWYRHLLDKNYKHCMLLIQDGLTESIVLYGLHADGIAIRTSRCNSLERYLAHMVEYQRLVSYIVVDIKWSVRIKQPLIRVNTCNELVRIASGINVGFTRTPKHLYDKIYLQVSSQYTILKKWNRT